MQEDVAEARADASEELRDAQRDASETSAEASADGETLWIALAWFIAGAGICCFSSPLAPASGERVRERGQTLPAAANVDFADLAVGLLIAGHVISGIVVVIAGGDHSLQSFPQHLPRILEFCRAAAV